MQEKYQVRIQPGARPRPHELSATYIMADYFRSDITILREGDSKTPDLFIERLGVTWEVKSPIGKGKYTIRNTFRSSKGQSDKLIIDLRRCKGNERRYLSQIRHFVREYGSRSHVRSVLVLMKSKEVIKIR